MSAASVRDPGWGPRPRPFETRSSVQSTAIRGGYESVRRDTARREHHVTTENGIDASRATSPSGRPPAGSETRPGRADTLIARPGRPTTAAVSSHAHSCAPCGDDIRVDERHIARLRVLCVRRRTRPPGDCRGHRRGGTGKAIDIHGQFRPGKRHVTGVVRSPPDDGGSQGTTSRTTCEPRVPRLINSITHINRPVSVRGAALSSQPLRARQAGARKEEPVAGSRLGDDVTRSPRWGAPGRLWQSWPVWKPSSARSVTGASAAAVTPSSRSPWPMARHRETGVMFLSARGFE